MSCWPVVFSIVLDETVDVNDVERVAIVARYCHNVRIYEELCCLIPLYGTVKGEDIITSFLSYFENQNIDLNKLFCVTTDGGPATVGIILSVKY